MTITFFSFVLHHRIHLLHPKAWMWQTFHKSTINSVVLLCHRMRFFLILFWFCFCFVFLFVSSIGISNQNDRKKDPSGSTIKYGSNNNNTKCVHNAIVVVFIVEIYLDVGWLKFRPFYISNAAFLYYHRNYVIIWYGVEVMAHPNALLAWHSFKLCVKALLISFFSFSNWMGSFQFWFPSMPINDDRKCLKWKKCHCP